MGEEEAKEEVIKYEDLVFPFPYPSGRIKEMEEEQPIGIRKKMDYKGQLLDVIQDDINVWIKTSAKNIYALIGKIRLKKGRKKKEASLDAKR